MTDDALEQVRLGDTPFGPLSQENATALIGGKMLRARLLLELGQACRTARPQVHAAAAAVEMLHAASLLHDDVIDAGQLRRGVPALWVKYGPKLAILLGDMLLSLAFRKMADSQPRAVAMMARTLAAMCQAECTQDLAIPPNAGTWANCLAVAEGKTGSLFALAAYCAAGDQPALARNLATAGSKLGTAYQLADDLLDLRTDETTVGKTLGTDARQQKLTAARFAHADGVTPVEVIHQMLADARSLLVPWPGVLAAWQDYVSTYLHPLLQDYTAGECVARM